MERLFLLLSLSPFDRRSAVILFSFTALLLSRRILQLFCLFRELAIAYPARSV
jgi:hypothetical protein